MNDEEPNKIVPTGNEPNKIEPNPTPVVEEPTENNALDRAEAANKEKKELLEREEKLQERKEKLHATQMVGGHTVAGKEEPKKEENPKEYMERINKEIGEGKEDGFT